MSSRVHGVKKIFYTSHFEKALKRLSSRIQELAHKKDLLFRENAFAPQLKTHKLTGKLRDLWSYSINRNYRVVFSFKENGKAAIYYDIGTHKIYT